MDEVLNQIKNQVYNQCHLAFTDFNLEVESSAYSACNFKINGLQVVYRNAKKTPKKVGQFVTFYKRSFLGPIEPFSDKDKIDFYTVTVENKNRRGQFIFPKAALIQNGILSTSHKEGKRAFRVYPIWDEVKSKQAIKTQNWQKAFFYEIHPQMDLKKLEALYTKPFLGK